MGFALSEMTVTSDSFTSGSAIPKRHTGEGEDISPHLTWSGAPDGAKSFVVVCHDPDAPLLKPGSYGYVHWLLYNLGAGTTSLAEGTSEGTRGVNDFGDKSYGGPMPPPGHGPHRYYYWVIALDRELDLPAGLDMPSLFARIETHALGMNRLVGTYER